MLTDREIRELKSTLNDYDKKIASIKREINYTESNARQTSGNIDRYVNQINDYKRSGYIININYNLKIKYFCKQKV